MWGREQRASASPMMARMMWQAVFEIDVRGVLDSVRTPTLVLGRRGDRIAPFESAAELAAANTERRAAGVTAGRALRDRPGRAASAGRAGIRWPASGCDACRAGAEHRPVHRHRRLDGTACRPGRRALASTARRSRPAGRQGAVEVRRPAGQAHRRRGLRVVRRPDEGRPLRPGPGARAGHPRHPDPRRRAHRRVREARRRVERHGRARRCPDRRDGGRGRGADQPHGARPLRRAPASSSKTWGCTV